MKAVLFFLGMGLMLGCAEEPVASVVTGGEENALDECTDPPVVDHDEISGSQPSNADVQILAYVYADGGCEVDIMTVDLHYRQETATEYNKVTMTRGQEPDQWRGMIGAESLTSAKIYYYIRAVDKAGQERVEPEDADTNLQKPYFFGVSTR